MDAEWWYAANEYQETEIALKLAVLPEPDKYKQLSL